MVNAAPANRGGRSVVLYDGQCEFCRRSVALLRRLDWLGRLRFQDARDSSHLPDLPLNPQGLLEQMHVVAPGGHRAYAGFRALRYLAWRLPALWMAAPVMYLPGIPALGQRIYLWVAKNRFRLVPCHGGVCALAKPQAGTWGVDHPARLP
jgi:predicted DCC family thiol-disulfide oxidoreductase YuxK